MVFSKMLDSNKKMHRILTISVLFLCFQGSSQQTKLNNTNHKNKVVYTVDKEGIYIYDQATKKSEKISNLQKDIIDNSLSFINDSVFIIGYRNLIIHESRNKITGEVLKCPCSSSESLVFNGIVKSYKYDRYDIYENYFKAINIRSKDTWLFKSIKYEHKENDTLTIRTTFFEKNGEITSIKDTKSRSTRHSSSSDDFNTFYSDRFYSESNIVNSKQVFTRRGNLYLRENGFETLLVEFEGNFDPKFGSGYYKPSLSKDEEKVAFQVLPGFLGKDFYIVEYDLKTKSKTTITNGFFEPKYSLDGIFLLLKKNNNIYIHDLRNGQTKKIAKGDNYIWNK